MKGLEVGRAFRARRARRGTFAAGSENPPYLGLAHALVLVPLLLVAFWPVWRWYAMRMTDGSDEPLGFVALLTAAAFVPRKGWSTPRPTAALAGVLAALVITIAAYDHLPALVRGAIAVGALACALPRDPVRPRLSLVALLLLSLPLIATLQFYLGFPLRAATTWCAAHALGLGGFDVVAHGTVLHWAGEEILVDAPCSGIRMLWTASFLSATLAALHRLPAAKLLRLAQWTATAVFVANLARTVLLFFLETGLWPNPPWAHEAAGLAMFFTAAAACVVSARALCLRPVPASP